MEMAEKIPETLLNSGYKMPMVGFGCAVQPSEELITILLDAIKIGYRHFDTAAGYGTEEALGKAVSQAIENGIVKGRDEFFITSKLWITDTHHDLVLPALKKSLGNLGLEYLDLYLVHLPLLVREGVVDIFKVSEEDLLPFDMNGTWKAMEECKKLGLVKSIGVSNFTCQKLSSLLENATIPPAVNQVAMNVGWQQRKLVPFFKEKNIHVSAFSPLATYGGFWDISVALDSPILKDIAASKGKTVAQIALRWIHEQGSSFIVKSFNKERMIQNLQIFSWELTKEEMEQIQKIPQHKGISGNSEGAIKYLEQLWDGDL
ncbi:hypothetical protein M9H77_14323 [Catharanthus roseus]|uniref:Uncharacterized protein n=1 Tax=Catharanthus roseus TaxID=4058 RepID=A0ACC0BN04_CATRO|nr:hypothetical protein M9H77_14323 [Catharanthus roseus]